MSQAGIYNPCTPPIRLKTERNNSPFKHLHMNSMPPKTKKEEGKAPSNKSENKNPYKETGVFVN